MDDSTRESSSLTEYISYEQIPPIYSALKHKGQPLYKLARKKNVPQEEIDKIIEAKKRTVKLYKMELTSYKHPYFTFIAHVSKGTYIRSLSNDIAKKIDFFATTHELKRTHIGKLSLKNATPLNQIETFDDINKHLVEKNELLKILMD